MKKRNLMYSFILVMAIFCLGIMTTEAQSKETSLKFAHGATKTFSLHYGAVDFIKIAEEASKGSLKFKLYPSGQLGPEREFIQAIMHGYVDIGVTTAFSLSNLTGLPEILVLELPWLFPNKDAYYRILNKNKSYKTIMTERLESKGLKYLGNADIGAYSVNANKPIRYPSDIAGMKLRVGENPIMLDTFKALKAQPVVVNFSEVFTALQQGVMDGIWTTTPLVHMIKTYEIAKEVSQLNTYCSAIVVMNLDKFNSLSKEEQDALEKGGRAYSETTKRVSSEETERNVAAMKKTGVKYYSLTSEEVTRFQKLMNPVYRKWRKKIGSEIFDEMRNFANKVQ